MLAAARHWGAPSAVVHAFAPAIGLRPPPVGRAARVGVVVTPALALVVVAAVPEKCSPELPHAASAKAQRQELMMIVKRFIPGSLGRRHPAPSRRTTTGIDDSQCVPGVVPI